MNSIEGPALSTIHVTPKDGFTYASFEATGYDFNVVNLGQMIHKVLECFQQEDFSVSMHSDFGGKLFDDVHELFLKGYSLDEKVYEELGLGGSIVYQKFARTAATCGSPRSTLKCFGDEESEEEEEEEENE